MKYILILMAAVFASNLVFAKSDINTVVSTGPCSYSLTLTTTASKEQIWRLWEEVDNWKSYDTILEYSYLKDNAPFEVGSVGYVNARGAPKTRFILTAMQHGESFTERLQLPLWNSLELKRKVVQLDDQTTAFTHEVVFKGPLKGVMYGLLAKTFKKELPLVMSRMRALAEKNSL